MQIGEQALLIQLLTCFVYILLGRTANFIGFVRLKLC